MGGWSLQRHFSGVSEEEILEDEGSAIEKLFLLRALRAFSEQLW